MFRFLALFLAGVILFSCKAKQTPEPEQEQGAFITLTLTRDSVATKTNFAISNVMVVNSKIRYLIDDIKKKDPNFLHITITYKNGKAIECYTEHPLFKRLDLYSESGKIESKSISLSQGEVVLRVPYFGKYKTVTIAETINFKEVQQVVLKQK